MTVRVEGDPLAAFANVSTAVKGALDAAVDKTALQVKDLARVVVRQALGDRAANTIGLRLWPSPDKPLAEGLYDRWWRDGQDVPGAFSVGATVRPLERQFLAVPSPALLAGELPTDLYQPGQLPSLGRLPLPSTGGPRSRAARLTPKSFEYRTGAKLRYIPPGRGRRFGMLVVDNARLTPKGQVRGSRRKVPRFSFIAFFLLPQTRIPQRIDWQPVLDFRDERLLVNTEDALAAVQAGIDGGARFSAAPY